MNAEQKHHTGINRRTLLTTLGAASVLAGAAAARERFSNLIITPPQLTESSTAQSTPQSTPSPDATKTVPASIGKVDSLQEAAADPMDTIFADVKTKPVFQSDLISEGSYRRGLRKQEGLAGNEQELLKSSVVIDSAGFTKDSKGNQTAYVLVEGGRVFRSEKGKAFKEVGTAPVDITREVIVRDQTIFVTGRRFTTPDMAKIQARSYPVASVSYDGGKSFQEMDLRLQPNYDAKLVPIAGNRFLVHCETNFLNGSEKNAKAPFNLALIEGDTITPIDIPFEIFSSIASAGVNKLDPNTAVIIGVGDSSAGIIYAEVDLSKKEFTKRDKLRGGGIDRLYPVIDEDGFPQEAFAFTADGKLVRIGLTIDKYREELDLQSLLNTRLNQVFANSKDNSGGFFTKGSMTISGTKGQTLWFSGIRYNASEGLQPFMASIPAERSYFLNIKPTDITIVLLAPTEITPQGKIKRRVYAYQGLETGISTVRIGKEEGVVGVFEPYLAFAGVNKDGTFNGKVAYPIKGLS